MSATAERMYQEAWGVVLNDADTYTAKHLSEAEAKRWAACWNACEQIEHPEDTFRDLVAFLRDVAATGGYSHRLHASALLNRMGAS